MDDSDIPRCRIAAPPEVFELGTVKDHRIHPDRVLPFWVFAVVTGGKMPIQIGDHRATLHPEQYFLLPPGVRHFGTERGAFNAVWLHFICPIESPGTPFHEFRLAMYGPVPPEISFQAWGSLLKRNMATGAMTPSDLGVQLMAMLGQVSAEESKLSSCRSGKSLAGKTLELLLEHYRERITTERISGELGYSYAHIEREFRKSHGITIRQKLNEIRVDEAQALMLMGTSIRDAARETGYSDYYYFIRVFTKFKGVSPGRLSERAGLNPKPPSAPD